ncbi:hypothetical protein J2W21_001716 [Sinomonas atrocyanea]|uniref:SRPBCC family protein n=1 Tax=Sinomonas atrocyanea TaxID=37927 RepID=UPI002781D99B|nr:SRPBCC family protein [Sinomonas atrocyanea]MDP9884206.1 hypothetical protein [Sinomonas atrocyanea]
MTVATTDYSFVTVWRVAGTREEAIQVLARVEDLPRWWPSVYLQVVLLEPGGPDGLGRRAALFTKGWLPYALHWDLEVTEPITPEGFAIAASGDLNGTGRWTLSQDGPETVIRYDRDVSVGKPLLRRLSWLLKPAFAANHRWAMARGHESLALELRRRGAPDRRTREAVPPAPGPTFRRR